MRLLITPEQIEADSSKDGYDLKIRNGVIGWYLDSAIWEPPWRCPGEDRGYTLAGLTSGFNSPFLSVTNQNRSFPFASDANATCVGCLPISLYCNTGLGSKTDGYSVGGSCGAGGGPPPISVCCMYKFPFASDGTASTVGSITAATAGRAGSGTDTFGYTAANTGIKKFPYSNETNYTSVGNLAIGCNLLAGHSSETHGYTSGGAGGPTNINSIQKYPFATDENATDIADLTCPTAGASGHSSYSHGYTAGTTPSIALYGDPITGTGINKFPFASDVNATCIGLITSPLQARRNVGGSSSTSNGYTFGGIGRNPISPVNDTSVLNILDKFPFASDASATSVGNSGGAVQVSGGTQV